jgi:hypothetical protein
LAGENRHRVERTNFMLFDEDRNRIRAEEIFRAAVRQQLLTQAPKDSSAKRFWAVLNSSFSLWFLSSVVLGGLTAAVAMYQRSHAEQTQRVQTQLRLNTEFSSRIENGLVALNLDVRRVDGGQAFLASAIYNEGLAYLDNRMTYNGQKLDFSVYPEYRDRGFQSLLFELRVVAEESGLPALRAAETDYKRLAELADQAAMTESRSGRMRPSKAQSLGAVAKAFELLGHLQAHGLWQVKR